MFTKTVIETCVNYEMFVFVYFTSLFIIKISEMVKIKKVKSSVFLYLTLLFKKYWCDAKNRRV